MPRAGEPSNQHVSVARQADIPEPRAFRGEIPERKHFGGPKLIAFPWKGHREIAMALPPSRGPNDELRGGWVLCGEAKRRGDGPKERRRLIMNMRKRLESLMDRRYPLERYQYAVVPAEGTDCDMELYMRFLGVLTPEEDAKDRARKRTNYENMLRHRREVKAARELQNRRRGGPGR